YSSAGDPRCDASLSQRLAIGLGIVPFVSMHLVRALTSSAPSALQRRNSIHHLLQHHGIRHVSTRTLQRKGYAPSADHKMALRAWFSLIRRVLACCLLRCLPFFTPLALSVCESKEALDQSFFP